MSIFPLRYLIQDVSYGASPRMALGVTSTQQYWGKGQKTAKNPGPVQSADYGKKFKVGKYIGVDPRPVHLRHTTDQERFDFIKDIQASSAKLGYQSNWDPTLKITYEDYNLSDQRKNELLQLTDQFILNLASSVNKEQNRIGTGIHLNNTLNQSLNDEWFYQRKYRVTASKFLEFSRNPTPFLRKFWHDEVIIQTKAMKYGIDNEDKAIVAIEQRLNCTVEKCGLIISKL